MSLVYAIRLRENSRKFIESAVEFAKREWPADATFAAVHLTTGLELLLKARLAVESHFLIAKKGQAVSSSQFEDGSFRSVTVDECVELLDQTGAFCLSASQKSVLRALQRLRNRAIHYIAPTEIEIKAALGAGLNLFLEIETSEFSHWDPPHQAKSLTELRSELHRYEEFIHARLSSIEEKLNLYARPRTHYFDECWNCSQDTTVIDGDYFLCLFCGSEYEIAFEIEGRSKDGKVAVCPKCDRRAFAAHEWFEVGFTRECFCCGYCEGTEPRWIDWEGKYIPRLHPERSDTATRLRAGISPEYFEKPL